VREKEGVREREEEEARGIDTKNTKERERESQGATARQRVCLRVHLFLKIVSAPSVV